MITGVLFIGLFVGLPVGLLLSHVGAGLSKNAKIGIGIGAGFAGFSLLVAFSALNRTYNLYGRAVHYVQAKGGRPAMTACVARALMPGTV
jgi:hypothetical protein